MKSVITAIESVSPLPSTLISLLEQQLAHHKLPANSLLLRPGQISDRIFFVEQGLIRGYYLKGDKDISTGFMAEGQFAISPGSFYTQQPSFEYLELLEDSLLWSLTHNQLSVLYELYPPFNYVGRVVTEQYYVKSELRTHKLRMLSAEERYDWFVIVYAALLNRLSGKHIASFLGLTPETISRIRARKAHN